jgi:hypothetical protein
MDSMPEHKALIAAIAGHPGVVAAVGASAVPTKRPVNGNIRLSGPEGEADIHIEMRGPNGQAVVAVEAEMKNRTWSLQRVAVQ